MIGFIGGTGPEGKGLALRLALAGQEVLIGSRDEERARQAAEQIVAKAPHIKARGVANAVAAQEAEVVFICVPFEAHKVTLQTLQGTLAGKLVVDVVAPVTFVGNKAKAVLVEEGSVAEQAGRLLPGARVVSAFQNVSAVDLLVPDRVLEGDVVVCGDDKEAKSQVMDMVKVIRSLRPVNGGGLENSRYVEDFTALLLNINRIYKARSMIRILGV